jgi:hypothetical protein
MDTNKFVRKFIKEIIEKEIENISEFEVGKCYDYLELPESTREDIDVQFKIFDENSSEASEKYDAYPEDYKYCFKLLQSKEILKRFPLAKDIIKKHKTKENSCLLDIMKSIQNGGLDYVPAGTEGNHRAAAFYLLNKEMPYLEIERKKYF